MDQTPNPPDLDALRGAQQVGITFTQHIAARQREFPEATGGLTALFQQIMVAAKIITREVRKAGLVDALGLTGKVNVQGEEVQFLDDFANQTIIRNVSHIGQLCVMSSEENADTIPIPRGFPCGKYALTFDPLDGSSNIDANVSIGTIFSLLPAVDGADRDDLASFLQPGRAQLAAGFFIYGPQLALVLTLGSGTDIFVYSPRVGQFLHAYAEVAIHTRTQEFAINASNYRHWDGAVRHYVDDCMQGADGPHGRDFNMRWIASLVADAYRIFIRGGIYL